MGYKAFNGSNFRMRNARNFNWIQFSHVRRHLSKSQDKNALTIEELVVKSQIKYGCKDRQDNIPTIHQTISGRKRFYRYVRIQSTEDNQYQITLDGKVLKSPGRNPLVFPNWLLAASVAAEWDAQTDHRHGIQTSTMPLMSIASTAIDQLPNEEGKQIVIKDCLRYLPTDSALFFTSEQDRLLLAKQHKIFLPIIQWFQDFLKIQLSTTESMSTKIQHLDDSSKKIESLLNIMDPFTLCCLQRAVYESKSIVLGLAYVFRFLSLEEIKIASRLEEEFQLEIWGVVEGGHDMDRLNNSVSLSSVDTFLHLLHDIQDHTHVLLPLDLILDQWKQSLSK